MKNIALFATMALVAGLFLAGQALGGSQHESGQSQWGSSSQRQGSQMEKYGSTPSTTGQAQQRMAAQQLNREQVRELQRLLNDQGFQAGDVDGIIGPKTRGALRDFQRTEGISSTGTPNEETLRALAPNAEKQEFFGLSPEFGEKEQQQMKEHQPMEQQQKQSPEGSRY